MSQSLNRIRSLVTEIEQIQKQGQRISRAAPRADLAPHAVEEEVRGEVPQRLESVSEPSVSAGPESSSFEKPEARGEPAFERRGETSGGGAETRADLALENRVMVQWSGNLVLELVLPQNAEKIEMKQIGDWIEIRFSDGKAFHIPFKNVA